MLNEEILRTQIDTDWAGRQIVFLESVDSTNEEAKRLAAKGAISGTLVVADMQTAGKGRQGRSFDSPKGEGIWMSLIIRDDIEPMNASMLTLVMGLAATEAIEEETGLRPQIKWPNDVILSGKKVCGILTEMSLTADRINYIVIGVGINVGNVNFPEEIRSVATSIFQESGSRSSRSSLVAQVLRRFEEYYHVFCEKQDLSGLAEVYNERLINRDRQVKVLDPKGEYWGRAVGITDTGELIVETNDQVRKVSSGEVSVRGVLGYV